VSKYKDNDSESAYVALGRALHTAQDKYAHRRAFLGGRKWKPLYTWKEWDSYRKKSKGNVYRTQHHTKVLTKSKNEAGEYVKRYEHDAWEIADWSCKIKVMNATQALLRKFKKATEGDPQGSSASLPFLPPPRDTM